MRMTEAQIRRVIREELLKEMGDMPPEREKDLEPMDYVKSFGAGAGVAGAAAGVNWLVWYVQTHPEVSEPLINLLKAMGAAVQE